MAQGYYEILGVSKNASGKDIRSAYRKLAREYHPDVNRSNLNAAERFKKVNEAYHILNDPKTRKDYDQFGENWKHADQIRDMGGAGGRSRAGAGPVFETFNGGGAAGFDLSDLFGMTGRPGGFGAQRASAEATVDITLDEAFHGTTRRLALNTPGAARNLEVKIPAGIPNGRRISLNSDGVQVSLTVNVLPHHRLRRDGDNLHVDVEVPVYDAVLGGEAEVPTMTGRVMLRIPEGTQNGRSFRVNGKGMPVMNSNRHGDLFATVKVRLPESLAEEERALFERLRSMRGSRAGGTPG